MLVKMWYEAFTWLTSVTGAVDLETVFSRKTDFGAGVEVTCGNI